MQPPVHIQHQVATVQLCSSLLYWCKKHVLCFTDSQDLVFYDSNAGLQCKPTASLPCSHSIWSPLFTHFLLPSPTPSILHPPHLSDLTTILLTSDVLYFPISTPTPKTPTFFIPLGPFQTSPQTTQQTNLTRTARHVRANM